MRRNLLWIFLITPLILSALGATFIGGNAIDTHDIAVISVTPSPTSVKLGELVGITVLVENQGTESETFDITAYYNITTIETKTDITLAAGANKSLTFAWDTTDVREEVYATTVKEKTYNVSATASVVPGETDTGDNRLGSPSTVRVISRYIMVLPQSIVDPTLIPGKNYTVSIYTDYSGTDIWGYEIYVSYNPLVLHGISVTNGDLIVNGTGGEDTGAMFMPGTFDNTNGELSLTSAFFYYSTPPPNLTYGPGILANITFEVVGEGDSDIKLGTSIIEGITKLKGYDEDKGGLYAIIDDITPALGHILHGYFSNTVTPVTHDITVFSVTPSPTNITAGEEVNIKVVVKNNGTVTENSDVTVYADETVTIIGDEIIIGTQHATDLAPGNLAGLTFSWNTTGVMLGAYTLSAEASVVPGETNTENNIMTTEWSVEVIPEFPTPTSILLILAILTASIVALKRRTRAGAKMHQKAA